MQRKKYKCDNSEYNWGDLQCRRVSEQQRRGSEIAKESRLPKSSQWRTCITQNITDLFVKKNIALFSLVFLGIKKVHELNMSSWNSLNIINRWILLQKQFHKELNDWHLQLFRIQFGIHDQDCVKVVTSGRYNGPTFIRHKEWKINHTSWSYSTRGNTFWMFNSYM